jgi:regulator of protease activity HflC (stomatin/prohibitin superfamily)
MERTTKMTNAPVTLPARAAPDVGRGWSKKRGVATALLLVLPLLMSCNVVRRVDPGYAGVLVDYGLGTATGQPAISSLQTGRYVALNPVTQDVAQYPISQQTLVMIRQKGDAQPKGDDSVSCQDGSGITLNVDSRTLWRVDPEQVGDLYLLRPGVPLTGKDGADISSQIVRTEVRNGLYMACSRFRYDEILGPRRLEFESTAAGLIAPNLRESHIVVDRFSLGAIHLEPDQQKAIQEKANAEQAALAAAYLRQKAENEAKAVVARAEGEAESIRILSEQVARSPEYLGYVYATKWDGKLPQTLVGGAEQVPVLATIQQGR